MLSHLVLLHFTWLFTLEGQLPSHFLLPWVTHMVHRLTTFLTTAVLSAAVPALLAQEQSRATIGISLWGCAADGGLRAGLRGAPCRVPTDRLVTVC